MNDETCDPTCDENGCPVTPRMQSPTDTRFEPDSEQRDRRGGMSAFDSAMQRACGTGCGGPDDNRPRPRRPEDTGPSPVSIPTQNLPGKSPATVPFGSMPQTPPDTKSTTSTVPMPGPQSSPAEFAAWVRTQTPAPFIPPATPFTPTQPVNTTPSSVPTPVSFPVGQVPMAPTTPSFRPASPVANTQAPQPSLGFQARPGTPTNFQYQPPRIPTPQAASPANAMPGVAIPGSGVVPDMDFSQDPAALGKPAGGGGDKSGGGAAGGKGGGATDYAPWLRGASDALRTGTDFILGVINSNNQAAIARVRADTDAKIAQLNADRNAASDPRTTAQKDQLIRDLQSLNRQLNNAAQGKPTDISNGGSDDVSTTTTTNTPAPVTTNTPPPPPADTGMSTGTKVAIGLGVAAAAYFAFRKGGPLANPAGRKLTPKQHHLGRVVKYPYHLAPR
jgi:hypothetical protein